MRCSKCGRLPVAEAPKWALPCMCGFICIDCGEPAAPGTHQLCAICVERAFSIIDAANASIDAKLLQEQKTNAMVTAIRNDSLVGRGTCSSIDECMDDKDLVKELTEQGISTIADAIKWAREGEESFLEEGLNQRWGEDDDPQLEAYNEFKEKMEKEKP